MTTLSKTLLTIAIAGLTLGSIVAHFGENISPVALAIALPVGAIALGLFLIVFALEKEIAAYDREQAMKGQASQCDVAPAQKTETFQFSGNEISKPFSNSQNDH